MRYFLQVLLAGVILSLYSVTNCFATHIYGGDLTYAWVSGNTYKIKLTLYGDCAGQNYPRLRTSYPKIKILNNTRTIDSTYLVLDTNSIVEVTPVCKAVIKILRNPLQIILSEIYTFICSTHVQAKLIILTIINLILIYG